jgi:putative Ca2+/H+ antiporter (TMEM165/GDT1 family)
MVAAFGVVFVAELGDRSQLLTLALGARYRPLAVLVGIAGAISVMLGLSVVVGAVVGDRIPVDTMNIVAGVAFVGFAVWTVLDRGEEERAEAEQEVAGQLHLDRSRNGWSVALTAAGAFVLAEIGDKTMFATVTLAARGDPVFVWAGAVLGELSANVIALVLGDRLGRHLPGRAVRLGAAVLFAAFGLLLFHQAVG